MLANIAFDRPTRQQRGHRQSPDVTTNGSAQLYFDLPADRGGGTFSDVTTVQCTTSAGRHRMGGCGRQVVVPSIVAHQ
jgi:hypothetical protein